MSNKKPLCPLCTSVVNIFFVPSVVKMRNIYIFVLAIWLSVSVYHNYKGGQRRVLSGIACPGGYAYD
ncbi:hypothetical protein [Methanocella conradii]|uniref:hypothetical protein n=1 Tax=Methanocella conradii TaxID=1175444 RepID=UPI0024B3899D|nr:hypothetical protein [Methanocella conradii]MDI6898114.1 hypothetical protein [Methanocella conradii]